MKEAIIHKEVWVPSLSPFRFKEQIDPKTGERKFIMKGLMLPFNTVSRNAVLYNTDSIKEKHKQLIGKPVMYNHKVDTDMMPKGHFINSWLEDDGWYYEADIDPNEKELIRKLERQDLRHVSIQLIGGKVMERVNESNQTYTEAWVEDVIEGSIVPAPGFLDTTASFAEALHPKKEKLYVLTKGDDQQVTVGDSALKKYLAKGWKIVNEEDMTTDTGAGAMAPTKIVGDDKDEKETNLIVEGIDKALVANVMDFFKSTPNPSDDQFHKWAEEKGINVHEAESAAYLLATIVSNLKYADVPDSEFDSKELSMGIEVEKEHTDDAEIAKAIAKAHLKEIPDYYTRLKKMEDDAMNSKAESLLSEMEKSEAIQILKEFSLDVGEYVRIPYGIDGKGQHYQGQIGKVVKVGDDSYTIEFEDEQTIKFDKEVFDISVVS